ncbi:hypothetical protein BCR35DRAFT_329698 [Leucosporidium creatinivorum]|uniref:Uncharacterized protein n=1 Tax=Leucosporidium creatinivorum TaxID=106004 RepID=A0A1Y2FXM6_9BASI|nr:hypothetical protein BCR35DRAFT_329698 [Leucosporidium creatinivorum]
MAAPLDRQQATAPLTRTLTQDSSNPSDFLLLTSARASTYPTNALPRPRFLPVLVAAAVLDFAWTVMYAVPLAWEARTGLWVAVAVSLVRPLLVLAVVTSVRVRERSSWILAQGMLSFLVLLYHVNELVQNGTPSTPTPPPEDSPAPPAVPSSFLASPLAPSIAAPQEQGFSITFSRSATVWYIISFGFSLLHYLLYAVFVGIRRKRNPFVGRRGPSTVGGRRVSGWGEQRWEGSEEVVHAPQLEREELLAGQGVGSSEEEFGDSEEEFDESSEDEDDIVDIPRPSLRSRRSTASFLVDEEGEGSRQRGEESGLMPRSRSQYGTIASISGI